MEEDSVLRQQVLSLFNTLHMICSILTSDNGTLSASDHQILDSSVLHHQNNSPQEIKEVMDHQQTTSVASHSEASFKSSSSSSFFHDISSFPQGYSDEILSPTILPTVMSSISDSLTYSSGQTYSAVSSSSTSHSSFYDPSNEQKHLIEACSNINFNAWDEKSNASSPEMLHNLKELMSIINNLDSEPPLKYIIIIIFYSLIVIVSSLGNLFVIWAIFSKKRTRTIVNIFIGNLACSDLMMTIFNIPFNVARLLMSNWIFGETLCHVVPFVQATSVYVSTLTMAFIAVDRFQAILCPMKPRISSKVGSCFAILIIWITSCLFSIPFLLFNRVVIRTEHFRPLTRCLVVYPEPSDSYKKSINVTTFILQFAIPLTIMVCLYTKIGMKIWSRVAIGATTREQETRQLAAKRKTIVMLLLVAIVFALCWLPLNLYHLLVDFSGYQTDFNTLIVVHWLAMSSVCYNPFIYFWLNRRRFEQIVRPGLLSLCNKACCGCESTLICPVKYPASSPTETSPPGMHELKRMRSCRKCHHGYHDDQANDATDGIHDVGTFSDVSEAVTAREVMEVMTRGKSVNNLSASPFGSTSISLQVNQVDIPVSGGKSRLLLTTASNSFSNFNSITPLNHLSVQQRNQNSRHSSSLSSKCFSCNVCQKQSISEETASMSGIRVTEQPTMTQSSSFQPQRNDNKKTSNKSPSPSESSCNNKKIWRYRNHHENKTRNHKNQTSLGPNNNLGFSNSFSEDRSSVSSCSSAAREDWKHHQHHIKCHYGRTWGTREKNRKTLKVGKEELTLTSL